jgi:exoribonuclease-2
LLTPKAEHGQSWESFPEDALAQLRALLPQAGEPQPGDAQRADLTSLRSFSIDDVETAEIDDAVAIESLGSGNQRIWVHVADPHRLLTPSSPLDQEALRRGCTLYLSEGLQPMLPLELGAALFSLSQGRRSPALSVGITLAQDGAIASTVIQRSWIQIAYRLSYEDGDELIDLAPPEEPELAWLDQLLQLRRRWRLDQGALVMEQSQGRLYRHGDGLELQITEPGPARQLVAEAMILAGAAVATWAAEHQLAMPFRCQEGNETVAAAALLALPDGPVRWAHQRLGLGRSRLQASASPHRALGLGEYLQWTSPIRRYADLLAHRQWLQASGLIEGAPLATAELVPELEQLEHRSRQALHIAREDQRLALLHWLEANPSFWQKQNGLLLRWLRADEGLALVWIDRWALELPARLSGNLVPGDILQLRVEAVQADKDLLRISGTAG